MGKNNRKSEVKVGKSYRITKPETTKTFLGEEFNLPAEDRAVTVVERPMDAGFPEDFVYCHEVGFSEPDWVHYPSYEWTPLQ